MRSNVVSKLGLQAITVIPQDPLLMEGTVAQNLDPFGRWSPDEIALALRKASLDPALASYQVTKSGMNLSSGERQLVCFARALLFRAKILVLDEPTASVDLPTDQKVQAMVRREFGKATLLCIAHRLNTIIDYDRILVMANGKAVEYGPPAELLQQEGGLLVDLVAALGPEAEADLRRQAGVPRSTPPTV